MKAGPPNPRWHRIYPCHSQRFIFPPKNVVLNADASCFPLSLAAFSALPGWPRLSFLEQSSLEVTLLSPHSWFSLASSRSPFQQPVLREASRSTDKKHPRAAPAPRYCLSRPPGSFPSKDFHGLKVSHFVHLLITYLPSVHSRAWCTESYLPSFVVLKTH